MSFRHVAVAALAAGSLNLLAATAHAADVTIANKAFGPADVTIAPGGSVTWNWGDGTHNVHVVQGPAQFDSGFKSAGGTFTKQLTAAGIYTYQCDAHPSMRGKVTVGSAGAATPATGTAPAPGLDLAPPRLAGVRVSTLAVLRLTASTAGRVELRIRRGARTVKRSTAKVAAGANRIPLAVRALKLGRYSVTVTAIDASGRRSAPVRRQLIVTRTARAHRATPQRLPVATLTPAAAPLPAPSDAEHEADHHHDAAHD
jgi:plastocyanin